MRAYNRITFCPQCGHRLMQRKKAIFSDRGFAYRERLCKGCRLTVYTKQPPEEITGVDESSRVTINQGTDHERKNIPQFEIRLR